MTKDEIKEWWADLFGAKFKNSATYRAVEEKLDQICNAHETEIEELRSAIDILVEEAAMYRNALDRNKEAHKTELKAKEEKHGDELQALLNDMGRAISKLSGELKAKDERITELEAKLESLRGYCRKLIEHFNSKDSRSDYDWGLRDRTITILDKLDEVKEQ